MQNTSLDNVYLCDIDGTIANHQGIRSPYDESKVHLDTPLPTCRVLNCLLAAGERVIFFSGRNDSCKKETIQWITQYIDDYNPEIYMRKSGDLRKDDIIKEELYEEHIKDKFNVLGVFDDRLKVCHMWYSLGLFVFNCNQGLKEF